MSILAAALPALGSFGTSAGAAASAAAPAAAGALGAAGGAGAQAGTLQQLMAFLKQIGFRGGFQGKNFSLGVDTREDGLQQLLDQLRSSNLGGQGVSQGVGQGGGVGAGGGITPVSIGGARPGFTNLIRPRGQGIPFKGA